MNSSSCEPITGARIGARPFTRAIRENIRTMAKPLNRSRTMAMATTPPPAAPMPISTRKKPSVVMSVDSAAPREATMCTAVARISGIRRPNLSLSGPTTSWPSGKADRGAGQRQLHGRLGDAQALFQRREGRQVQVHREGPQGGQGAEHQNVEELAAAAQGIAGIGGCSHRGQS